MVQVQHTIDDFQEWNGINVFKNIWIKLLKIYDDMIGINWT